MAIFCLLCGKRFQTQTALQQHMEVHAGVRSYICSECNRTFPSHTALKRHLRSHTGRWRCRWDTYVSASLTNHTCHNNWRNTSQNIPTEGTFPRFKGKNAAPIFLSLQLKSRGSLFLYANVASLNFTYFLSRMAAKIPNNFSSRAHPGVLERP